MKRVTYLAAAITAAFALPPHNARALGFRITDLGAKGTARGGAVVATADDPSAIYNNPAGITQMEGTNSLLGSNFIAFETSVQSASGGPTFDSNYAPQAVPVSFMTWHPKDSRVALGLGSYAPFGLALEFDDSVPFRTVGVKGSILFATYNPVIAYQISDSLSVAAGATFSYSKVMLARGIVVRGDEFQFKGTGVGYGFNLGVLWQPHPMHSFGISYFSAIDVEYSGHSHVRIPSFSAATPAGEFRSAQVKYELDSDATIPYPSTLRMGYSFRPTPDWNFEIDAEWTDWDRLNTVALHQSTGALSIPFNYESSWFYEFGVTRQLPWNMSASAGYIYSENSVPNESFSPLVPDSNRHVLSAGLGKQFDRYTWNISYQYAYGPHRTIAQGTSADGVYRFESHAVSFSVGYRF